MSIFESLILGIIQGITEFIPVSSSGHLLITHEIFGSNGSTLAFDVALHVGTLLALLLFFRKDLIDLLKNGLDLNPANGDVMGGFSSRGPQLAFNVLKPACAAKPAKKPRSSATVPATALTRSRPALARWPADSYGSR